MSAMTAAALRRLRARITAPELGPAARNDAAWTYLDAARKTPTLLRVWSRLTERGSRTERRERWARIDAILTWEVR